MTPQTNADAFLFHDLYKDVFGVRPDSGVVATFNGFTPAEARASCDHLQRMLAEREAEECAEEHRAVVELKASVDRVAARVEGDRTAALRYLMDAQDLSSNVRIDREHFLYIHGCSLETDGEGYRWMADLLGEPIS